MQELARAQNVKVSHLSDLFPRDTRDVTWIRELGRQGGWVIVSADPHISRNRVERAAWKESGLTAFFFDSGFSSRQFWVQSEEMVRCWPIIMSTAKVAPKGSGFLLKFKARQPTPIYS